MTRFHFLFILAAILLFSSCQKDTSPLYVYDVKDEFNIQIYQKLTSTNTIILKLSTVDSFPDNYRIDADFNKYNNRHELNIYRIIAHATPSTRKGIITKRIELPDFDLGEYPLDFIIRNAIVNQGALSIGIQKIELNFSTKSAITSKHYEINRIPANSYWGVAYVNANYHDLFVDKFMSEIRSESSAIQNPLTGDYGYFSIDPNGVIDLPLSPAGYSKTFFMTSDNMEGINQSIQKYKQFQVGFHSTIFTASGQIFHHVSNDTATDSLHAAKPTATAPSK